MGVRSFFVTSTSSSATVKSGPGLIHTMTLAAGSDAATAIVYDNTAASGTVLWKLSSVANDSETARLDIPFSTGCHVALTGTDPQFSIAYR